MTTVEIMSEALVLAGGGTKAAFEVGALLFLTRDGNFAPRIIAGTSAGSMIAATMAQGHGGEQARQLARVVQSNVLAVTDLNAVFGKQSWLQHIEGTPFAAVVDEILAQGSRPKLPGTTEFEVEIESSTHATARRKRVLTAMSAAIGHAPTVIRAGRTFLSEGNALLSMDPLEASLRGEHDAGVAPVDETAIAESGVALRLAISALGDGVARYVTETGDVVESDSGTPRPTGGRPGVVEGVLASSSVPLVFPPRRIGDDVYCDGGVIQTAPLEAAVRVGAGDVTALMASPLFKPRDDVDYANASIMAIYSRAVAGVAQMAAIRANLGYPLADGARLRVIAPTVEIVGTFEVSPGLMSIAIDYGWLRAAETTAGLSEVDAAELGVLSDAIAVGRARAWQLEEHLLRDPGGEDVIASLTDVRRETADAAARWSRACLDPPERFAVVATGWEYHRAEIPDHLQALGLP